jgi:hypothetical protein
MLGEEGRYQSCCVVLLCLTFYCTLVSPIYIRWDMILHKHSFLLDTFYFGCILLFYFLLYIQIAMFRKSAIGLIVYKSMCVDS